MFQAVHELGRNGITRSAASVVGGDTVFRVRVSALDYKSRNHTVESASIEKAFPGKFEEIIAVLRRLAVQPNVHVSEGGLNDGNGFGGLTIRRTTTDFFLLAARSNQQQGQRKRQN